MGQKCVLRCQLTYIPCVHFLFSVQASWAVHVFPQTSGRLPAEDPRLLWAQIPGQDVWWGKHFGRTERAIKRGTSYQQETVHTQLITCVKTDSKLTSAPPGNSQLQLPEAGGVHAALRQRRSQLCDSNVNQAPLRGLPTWRLHRSRGNYRQEDVLHSAWRSQHPDQRDYRHEALRWLLLWG